VRNAIPSLLCAGILLVTPAAHAAPRGAKSPPPPPDTAMVTLGSGEQTTQAFVAWPVKRAGAAGIVVVHESWGLNEQIRDVARRLSREGYVAIVPDLYHVRSATDPELAHELAHALDDTRALTDLAAAIEWLRGQPETQKSKLGVVGFCMGGGLSQRLALAHPELSAAVMFNGGPETDPAVLKALAVPLQAHFGATDREIPPTRAEDLRRGLEAAGKEGEVYVYAGAGHAFMNDEGSSYHRDAARQAWARMLGFLQRHLRG
jgi:carboxymethylenebutenolidase